MSSAAPSLRRHGARLSQLCALALLSCSSSSSKQAPSALPDGGKSICTPGSTQACLGPGRCEGAQVCDDQGARFGPCSCAPGSDASSGSGGGSGTGGAGASGNRDAGGAGSGGSGGQSLADARSDAPLSDCTNAATGTPCLSSTGLAGTCFTGACCTGCVSAGVCHLGTEFSFCGKGGESCRVCSGDTPVCNQPTDPECSGKAGFHPYGCYGNTCTHQTQCCSGNTCNANGCGN